MPSLPFAVPHIEHDENTGGSNLPDTRRPLDKDAKHKQAPQGRRGGNKKSAKSVPGTRSHIHPDSTKPSKAPQGGRSGGSKRTIPRPTLKEALTAPGKTAAQHAPQGEHSGGRNRKTKGPGYTPWHKRKTIDGKKITKEDAAKILNDAEAAEDKHRQGAEDWKNWNPPEEKHKPVGEKGFVGEIDITDKPPRKGVRDLIGEAKAAEAPPEKPVTPIFDDKDDKETEPKKKVVGGKPTRKVTNRGAEQSSSTSFDYSNIDEARALRQKADAIQGTMAKSAYEGDIGGHIERGRNVKALRDAAARAEAQGVRVRSSSSRSSGPSSTVDNDRSALKTVDAPEERPSQVPEKEPVAPEAPTEPDFSKVDFENLPAPPQPNIMKSFMGQGKFGNMA